ncbi:uncharacterized protein [Triticum aestivum]|uniref:uncharacterized protein isoform X2 n=1 Tax=Triticum aestivum TaxID=4565 RepID=UPI001D00631E|nr:uncharacterized protein LOC123054093 isoform X2 [Triticum aestivum]
MGFMSPLAAVHGRIHGPDAWICGLAVVAGRWRWCGGVAGYSPFGGWFLLLRERALDLDAGCFSATWSWFQPLVARRWLGHGRRRGCHGPLRRLVQTDWDVAGGGAQVVAGADGAKDFIPTNRWLRTVDLPGRIAFMSLPRSRG